MAKIHSSEKKPSFSSASGRGGVYFFAYLVVLNSILSYSCLPTGLQGVAAFLGIIVPFLYCLFKQKTFESEVNPFQWGSARPEFSVWGAIPLAVLAVLFRLYRLSDLTPWPSLEEAVNGYYGLRSAQGPGFPLFIGLGQTPPLFDWVLGFAFKVFGVSLSTLWAVPAFFSILTLPMVWWAVRIFSNRSLAWLFTWLWAFSFWPLLEGRYCAQYSLLMFWFWLTAYILGVFLKSPKGWKLGLLVLAVGTGFYISSVWLLVSLALVASFFLFGGSSSRYFSIFVRLVFLTMVPLLILVLNRQLANPPAALWGYDGRVPLAGRALNALNYFRGLFWGVPPLYRTFSNGPHWGGLFNPLLASFFFLGFRRLWGFRNRPWAQLLMGSLAFFLSPALLGWKMDFFQILPALPVFLFVIALGADSLPGKLPARSGSWVLGGVLLISMGMDAYHLAGPFAAGAAGENAWFSKSYGRFQAYKVLEETRQRLGPGLVFDQFPSVLTGSYAPGAYDPSLALATYPYNAVVNPAIYWGDARWAGILCDSALQPGLARAFPDAKWAFLADRPERGGENLALGLILQPAAYAPILQKWVGADAQFRTVTDSVLSHVMGQPYWDILEVIQRVRLQVAGDSFLETCLNLKAAEMDALNNGKLPPSVKINYSDSAGK